MIVLDHDGVFVAFLTLMNIILCLLSSYFYVWMGTFGEEHTHWAILFATTCLEYIFSGLMICKFITSYQIQGETEIVKSIHSISMRYLKNGFLLDFLTLLPLHFVFGHKYLYLIKTIRVVIVIQVFNI